MIYCLLKLITIIVKKMILKNWIYKTYYVIILFSIIFSSCSTNENDLFKESVKTKIPNDITKLFIEKGNTNSNKVILYSNGGPEHILDTKYFDELSFSEFHEVYVHQSNTYNQTILNNGYLTFERAIEENEISVEILHRVAKYFNDQGKEVYIVGHSFGAILIPSLIATKPPIAKKYLLMAGRLDFPDLVWKGFRDQQGYNFIDGILPTKQFLDNTVNDIERKRYYARMKLQAGFGKNRYTQLLQNKDLTNVIYAYGEKDEAVGSLTKEETSFLKAKNANVYVVPNGTHGSMIDFPHRESLKKLLFKQ